MKKAILFTGDVLHGNVARMLAGLARGLAACGVGASLLDVRRPDFAETLRRAVAGGEADFFVSATGLGLDLRAENNLFDRIGLPLVSMYFDPLVGYADQVSVPIRRRIVTTVSDCDLDYWQAVAPAIAVRHLPHAAEPGSGRPWAERDIALLFPATGCENPERTRESWTRHGAKVAAELNAVLETHLAAPLRPLTAAIEEILGGRLDVRNPYAIHPYFATLDVYLRAHARWRLLESLRGLPVTVAGGGWDAFAARHADCGFVLLGARPADEIQALMARAKIVLNACTGFHGTHERVFDAQAAGAAAATVPTRWFDAHAPEEAVIRLDMADAADNIGRRLARDRETERIAANGRAWQAQRHTWEHRARDLMAWIGAI
jgi:hypothetical protein